MQIEYTEISKPGHTKIEGRNQVSDFILAFIYHPIYCLNIIKLKLQQVGVLGR